VPFGDRHTDDWLINYRRRITIVITTTNEQLAFWPKSVSTGLLMDLNESWYTGLDAEW